LDEVQKPNAEWHADYGDAVKIKTGSRISTRWTVAFPKQEVYLSGGLRCR